MEKALSKSNDADLILIVGDIADRADEKQYDIFLKLIDEKSHGTPVYCVWGNHDMKVVFSCVDPNIFKCISAELKQL